jgi:hypothetical protein
MDVDIDPSDDKASQGDDAEAPPTPGKRRPVETGPSAHGVRSKGPGRK